MEEKMEGKGKNGGFDIFADDKKQLGGLIPGPYDDTKKGAVVQNMHGILQQVPDEAEIKELLKGKTAKEKKGLLKEIENARQAKIHMTYLLAQ